MSFEDAETLSHTMARTGFSENRSRLLQSWEKHRQQRVQMVKDFTDASGRLRAPTSGFWKQYVKEWVMWILISVRGPKMGMEWLYNYNPEDIAKAY